MRAGLKMLKLDKILDKRADVNITVNRIRSSVETVMCEEIETDTRLRSAMARSAQHSVSTASKHYHPGAVDWIPEAHFYELSKCRVIKWSVTVTFQKMVEKFKYHVKDKRFSYPGH